VQDERGIPILDSAGPEGTIGLPKNRRSPVYCPTLTRLTIAPSIYLACAALRAGLNVQIADGLDWFINVRPEHLFDGVQR